MFMCLSVLVLAIVGASAQNETIDCCPPGKFISFKMSKCWIPSTNDTSPLRLSCKKFIRVKNFTVNSEGNIEIPIPYLRPEITGPDV